MKKDNQIRRKVFDTDTKYQWQTNTFCDRNKHSLTHSDCLWQTQTDCDRHRLAMTDTECNWQTDCMWQTKTDCLSQTNTVCDRHRLSVTNTRYLWQTHNVGNRYSLSETNIYCLWLNVCDKQRLSVTSDTICYRHRLYASEKDCLLKKKKKNCLWQKKNETVCDRDTLSVTRREGMGGTLDHAPWGYATICHLSSVRNRLSVTNRNYW